MGCACVSKTALYRTKKSQNHRMIKNGGGGTTPRFNQSKREEKSFSGTVFVSSLGGNGFASVVMR